MRSPVRRATRSATPGEGGISDDEPTEVPARRAEEMFDAAERVRDGAPRESSEEECVEPSLPEGAEGSKTERGVSVARRKRREGTPTRGRAPGRIAGGDDAIDIGRGWGVTSRGRGEVSLLNRPLDTFSSGAFAGRRGLSHACTFSC